MAGALQCAAGLAALTFGLVRAPEVGLADPTVAGPLVASLVLMVAFVLHERRIEHPMLNLELFRIHNFAIGNLQTLSMYAGLSLLFFFLVIFLQAGAGYSAVAAGTASVPVTLVMFTLSSRFGALADRYGPRFFMGVGPLVAAAGLALMTTVDADVELLHRAAAAAAGVLAGPVDDGRPADRHGAGGGRRGQRRHGQRDQQRHRAHRGAAGHRAGGRAGGGPLRRARPTRPWTRSTSPWSSRRCWWRWAGWPP